MIDFISGAIAMGYAVSGLCFLKFWRQSRDRLFFLFALGFFMLAANRIVGVTFPESGAALYPQVVRLLAFSIIIIAIVDKNLRPK